MVKEVKRKDFIRSMSKHYMKALAENTPYFMVVNTKGFRRSFLVVNPEWLVGCLVMANQHLEADELRDKMQEIIERVSSNSKARANKRWNNVDGKTNTEGIANTKNSDYYLPISGSDIDSESVEV